MADSVPPATVPEPVMVSVVSAGMLIAGPPLAASVCPSRFRIAVSASSGSVKSMLSVTSVSNVMVEPSSSTCWIAACRLAYVLSPTCATADGGASVHAAAVWPGNSARVQHSIMNMKNIRLLIDRCMIILSVWRAKV